MKIFGNSESIHKVILLHGGPGMDDSYFFPYLIELGEKFEIISYTQLKKEDLTMKDLVGELKNICDSYRNAKIHLVGHSFGGVLATEFISRYPNIVESLTLISSPYSSSWVDVFMNNYPDFEKEKLSVIYSAKLTADEIYKERSLIYSSLYFSKDKENEGKKVLNKIKYFEASLSSMYQDYMNDFDQTNILRELQIPVLYLYGEDDNILDSKYVKEVTRLNENIKYQEMTGAGHFPFVEKPDFVISKIVEHIEKE